ncbi:hypothetical protein ABZ778_33585 [Streptomyces bacillaris]|uniref:hypothetical protein n=1 Tax=Streptomyces bacillaris TaxID=68179 RepID=UPI003460AD05
MTNERDAPMRGILRPGAGRRTEAAGRPAKTVGRRAGRLRAVAAKAVSAVVAAAVLGGLTTPAQAAAPDAPVAMPSAAALLASALRAEADAPAPGAPMTSLARLSADADRQLVEDYAEFDEEEEVREAARKALESTDPNALRDFLERGEAEARKRAQDKRNAADVENREKIEALRGTGGPYFNAEVERVLKGTAGDRPTSWPSARRSPGSGTRPPRRTSASGPRSSASGSRCSQPAAAPRCSGWPGSPWPPVTTRPSRSSWTRATRSRRRRTPTSGPPGRRSRRRRWSRRSGCASWPRTPPAPLRPVPS